MEIETCSQIIYYGLLLIPVVLIAMMFLRCITNKNKSLLNIDKIKQEIKSLKKRYVCLYGITIIIGIRFGLKYSSNDFKISAMSIILIMSGIMIHFVSLIKLKEFRSKFREDNIIDSIEMVMLNIICIYSSIFIIKPNKNPFIKKTEILAIIILFIGYIYIFYILIKIIINQSNLLKKDESSDDVNSFKILNKLVIPVILILVGTFFCMNSILNSFNKNYYLINGTIDFKSQLDILYYTLSTFITFSCENIQANHWSSRLVCLISRFSTVLVISFLFNVMVGLIPRYDYKEKEYDFKDINEKCKEVLDKKELSDDLENIKSISVTSLEHIDKRNLYNDNQYSNSKNILKGKSKESDSNIYNIIENLSNEIKNIINEVYNMNYALNIQKENVQHTKDVFKSISGEIESIEFKIKVINKTLEELDVNKENTSDVIEKLTSNFQWLSLEVNKIKELIKNFDSSVNELNVSIKELDEYINKVKEG